VRPIITLDGEHEVNEVFFTDVRVPVENLVGEENAGWTCAKYLLTYERTNIAGVGFSVAALARLKRIAAPRPATASRCSEDPILRRAPGAGRDRPREHEDDQPARDRGGGRRRRAGRGKLDAEDSRHRDPPGDHLAGPARDGRACASLQPGHARCRLPGPDFRPDFAPAASAQYFNNRKLSIFGGSNEIQKNIISKMILGL
jgi:hypothetical protein